MHETTSYSRVVRAVLGSRDTAPQFLMGMGLMQVAASSMQGRTCHVAQQCACVSPVQTFFLYSYDLELSYQIALAVVLTEESWCYAVMVQGHVLRVRWHNNMQNQSEHWNT
jgi:hypothetical protein